VPNSSANARRSIFEWLYAGVLADTIGEFLETLSPPQKAEYQRIDGRLCAHVEFGASCGNLAAIRAADQFHLIADLVGRVCRAPYVCTAVAACTTTHQ
jgi:hypothetical protein